MKKILRKIINFIKGHKLLFIILAAIIVIAILIYFIFFKINIPTVKRVKKVLKPNYYSVECLDSDCNYIVAYKGDKFGKHTIYIYNSNGKKIAKINDKYDNKSSYTKNVTDATKNYVIFSKTDYVTSKTNGYVLTNTKGKSKYNSKNYLYSLTDNLVAEKTKNTHKIIDNDGKTIFKDATNIKVYANNSIVSIDSDNETLILDSKGKTLLSGYSIATEVADEKGNPLFFVVEDANKNAYYFYNYKKNKVGEESFSGYNKGINAGELIVTKNDNGFVKKYTLTSKGVLEDLISENQNDLVNSIKTNIDASEYSIYSNSIRNKNQKVVLVNSKKDNSLGVYNLSNKKYSRLLKYNKESGAATISILESNDNELYVQINCRSNYCKKPTMIIYDVLNNNELYRTENENSIQSYTGYSGNYKVIKYSIDSEENYKEKYVVYDKNNKELFKSDKQIVIVDKEVLFGKEAYSSSLLLFSSKQNKTINKEDNLASKLAVGSTYIYKYNDNKNTYLVNSKGKIIKKIEGNKVSFIYGEDSIIYLGKDKLNIINPVDNRVKNYKLKKNEKINDNSGENIAPYKNSVYINNTVNNYIKVVNANGRAVKRIKNATINSVKYNKKTNSVIIITKRINGNNNSYGLYIAK